MNTGSRCGACGSTGVPLGPWDHGARIDVSPWRQSVEPGFPLLGEVLRFFDTYLMGHDTGLRDEAPIHYYALHAEAWRAAPSWPPVDAGARFFLAPDHRLADAMSAAGTDDYQVDFTLGTGTHTRYERIAGIDCRHYYADWQGRSQRMLSFTSARSASKRSRAHACSRSVAGWRIRLASRCIR